jgi:hypothetical protein
MRKRLQKAYVKDPSSDGAEVRNVATASTESAAA